jgi:hypothetical protein
MPDTIVEDEFAHFALAYTDTFRPVPVEAMPGWRRRRRRGALWAGGLIAAVVAALVANTLQPAAPAPADQVTERTVRLDGARGTMSVGFSDARRGWVMFSDCPAEDRCDITLGRTTDAGRSWHRVAGPVLPERGRARLIPTGAESALLGVETNWWETNDGGRSFQALPVDRAYAVYDSYVALRYLPGPGASGEATSPGAGTERWKTVHAGLATHVYYSPDGDAWRELPTELPAGGLLKVSQDGRDAWVLTEMPNRAWRLTPRDAVEQPGFPASAVIGLAQPVADGGLIITVPGEGAGVWRAGRLAPFPGPMARAFAAHVLDDGTLVLELPGEGTVLGALGGPWTWYRPPPA